VLFCLPLALLLPDGVAAGACRLFLLGLGGTRTVFPDRSLAFFAAHGNRVTRDKPRDAASKSGDGGLTFSPRDVLERASAIGDLFRPVLELPQRLLA
jgi:hypothetical protein